MIHRPTLFLIQTFVILLVAAVHLSALEWYLYWYYPWLDLFTHFLGGLWVALASAWLITYTGRKSSLIQIVLMTMLVGIGWEVFEFLGGIPREDNFVFDTSLDLLMDFCGGCIGYIVSRRAVVQSSLNGETTKNNPS